MWGTGTSDTTLGTGTGNCSVYELDEEPTTHSRSPLRHGCRVRRTRADFGLSVASEAPVSSVQSARSNVRIVIVEDHALFAEALELTLNMEGYDARRVKVPENAASTSALLAAVIRAHPKIVLLDLDLGGVGDGARLIGPIAKSGAHVVVITGSRDLDRWGECMRYGARRVVAKTGSLNDALVTVRRLNHGLPVMDREERERLIQRWHREAQLRGERRQRIDRLTPREKQVLAHLMEGHTVRDIAHLSVVSEATVRTQVKAILSKLQVSSQVAAVGLAHQVAWHPPEVTSASDDRSQRRGGSIGGAQARARP